MALLVEWTGLGGSGLYEFALTYRAPSLNLYAAC